MSGDAKTQKPQGRSQAGENGLAKGPLHLFGRSTGMDGCQPRKDEVTRGYRPTQLVDMSNLKIPKNLGDAAVMPRNGGNPLRTSVEAKKQ